MEPFAFQLNTCVGLSHVTEYRWAVELNGIDGAMNQNVFRLSWKSIRSCDHTPNKSTTIFGHFTSSTHKGYLCMHFNGSLWILLTDLPSKLELWNISLLNFRNSREWHNYIVLFSSAYPSVKDILITSLSIFPPKFKRLLTKFNVADLKRKIKIFSLNIGRKCLTFYKSI